MQPAEPRRSARIRKPKFEINPEPKKVRPIAPKSVDAATEKTSVEISPKKSLKFSSVVESAQDITNKANTTTAIPKSAKKIVGGKRGSKLSLVKRTVNDLEDNPEHHLKKRLLAAFR